MAVHYLRELSTTWRRAHGGLGRKMLPEVLFSRIEVLGGVEATLHLTDLAVADGFATAIPNRLDVTVGYGRGERRQATLRHLNVPTSLTLEIEVTGTERWLRNSTD